MHINMSLPPLEVFYYYRCGTNTGVILLQV